LAYRCVEKLVNRAGERFGASPSIAPRSEFRQGGRPSADRCPVGSHATVTGWHEVNDLARCRRVLITGHYQGTWRDLGGASLIQEGPEVSGLVFVLKIGGDVDRYISALSP
jgi:hypothetical protein